MVVLGVSLHSAYAEPQGNTFSTGRESPPTEAADENMGYHARDEVGGVAGRRRPFADGLLPMSRNGAHPTHSGCEPGLTIKVLSARRLSRVKDTS